MKRWPSLGKVLFVWAVLTALAIGFYVFFLYQAPAEELEMAGTFSFKLTIAAISVGLPAVVFLFLFLLLGAICKRWLVSSNPSIEGTASSGLRPPPAAPHVKR